MSSKFLLLPIIGATVFFTLLFTFTKLFGPIPFSVTSVTTQKSTTFDVIGEGKVTVKPDIASITVGITANAKTVKEAQEQINTTINKVSASIKELGVDSKDIQTTNYNVNPEYDPSTGSGQARIKGYIASTNLNIKVKQIDKVNQVIDLATASGANQVGGINFGLEDKTEAENEARQKAVDEAKRKAKDAEKIAGFKLGRIINYSENFNGYPRPIYMTSTLDAKGSLESPTQVESGSTDISISVTLSYEIQ